MLIALLIVSFCCQLNATEHDAEFRTAEMVHRLWQTIKQQPPVNRKDLLKTGFDDENHANPWGMKTYCQNQIHDPLWQQFSYLPDVEREHCFKNFVFGLVQARGNISRYRYARCLVLNCLENHYQHFYKGFSDEETNALVEHAARYNDKNMILSVKLHSSAKHFPSILWPALSQARTLDIAQLLNQDDIHSRNKQIRPPYATYFMVEEFSSALLDYWYIDANGAYILDQLPAGHVATPGTLLHQLIFSAAEHTQDELQKKFAWLMGHAKPEILRISIEFYGKKTPSELTNYLLESNTASVQLQWLQQALQATADK